MASHNVVHINLLEMSRKFPWKLCWLPGKMKNDRCVESRSRLKQVFLKLLSTNHILEQSQWKAQGNRRRISEVYVSGGGFNFFFFNEVLNSDHSTPLGIRSRRPVHNHALVSTADFGSSTWFSTGR